MKWQLLVALFALLAAMALANESAGVTYVESAAELPSHGGHLEKGYSFISHDANEEADADADADEEAEQDSEESESSELEGAFEASLVQLAAPKRSFNTKAQEQLIAKMDPFAAKHYQKGFKVGRFNRPDLVTNAKTSSFTKAKMIEDCLACRFVWKSVEMDVGNTEQQKTVYDSFVNHCRQGMKAPIMFAPCQLMFAAVDDMITGYVAGMTVNEMCAQAKLCR